MPFSFVKTRPINKVITSQAKFDSLTVESGDRILLKGEFVGSLDIDQPNVTVEGGTITGGEDISGLTFTDQGSDIWTTPMTEDPKWINFDGTAAKMAETPGWFDVGSAPAPNQVSVATGDLSGYTDIIGSYLVFWSRPFSYSERYTVTNYNGAGLITVDRDLHVSIGGNSYYRLFNNTEYFDGDKEWVWRDNVLTIKSAVDPSTLNITKSSHDYAFNITAPKSFIKKVELKEQFLYGILSTANKFEAAHCNIHDIRGNGVKCQVQTESVILNQNTVNNIGHNGFWLGPQTNISVVRNRITNIGMGGNIGWNNASFGAASQTDGCAMKWNIDLNNLDHDASNIYVAYNYIENTAYNGISFHIGQNGWVRRNQVYNTNNLLADGAPIHTYHYLNFLEAFTGFIIEENFTETQSALDKVRSIYQDQKCKNNIVRYNTSICANGNATFHINTDNEGHTYAENIAISGGDAVQRWRNWASAFKEYNNQKHKLAGNLYISETGSIPAFQFSDGVTPFASGGSSDNNYFARPSGAYVLDDGLNKTLAQLTADYGTDGSSVEFTYTAYKLYKNPSDDPLSQTADTGNWYTKDGVLTTDFTVKPWRSVVLFKDYTLI